METKSCSTTRKRKCSDSSTASDDSIKDQLEAIKAENARLKKDLEISNATVGKFYIANAGLTSNEEREAEMNRLKETEKELRAELDKTKDEQLKHKGEINKLKLHMEDQAEEGRLKIAFRDNEFKELKKQLSGNQSWLNFGKIKRKYEDKFKALNSQVDELTQKNILLETEAKEAQQKDDAHEKELKEQLVNAKRDIVEFQTKNNVLEYDKRNDEAKINAMKSHIDNLTKKNTALEAQAQENHRESFARYNEILDLRKELISANAAKNELSAKIAACNDVLTNAERTVETKINDLKSSIDTLTKKGSESEVKLQTSSAEYEKQIQATKDEQQKAEAKIVELKTRIDELTKKNDKSEEKHQKCVAEFEKKIQAIKDEQEKAEAKITDLKSAIDNLSKKNSESEVKLQKSVAEYQKQIQALKDELQKAEADYGIKVEQNAEEAEANYRITFTAMNADRQKAFDENDEYKKKIQALEEQLHASKDESDLRCNEMKQKEDEARTILIDQQKKIFELENQLQKTNNEMKQKEDQTNTTNSDLRDLQAQLRETNETLTLSRKHKIYRNITAEDVWMNECRSLCDQILNEKAIKLLSEASEENIEKIFDKFEERKYNSPNEYLAALTNVIRKNLNNYYYGTSSYQLLITVKQKLNADFNPIIEKFTQIMKGEQPLRSKRIAAKKARFT